MMSVTRAAFVATLLAGAGAVQAQTITSIGGLTSVAPSGVYSVSADGSAAAGFSTPSGNMRAVRWTSAGLQNLGVVPGGLRSQAFSISDDGGVVAGSSIVPGGGHAFRWTPGAGMQDLGTLPGQNITFAYAVSRDGLVIGGGPSSGAAGHAFIWRSGAGMTDAGVLAGNADASIYALNQDGSAGAGVSGSRAVRWTAAGFADLGLLAGASEAEAISADGQTITGFCTIGGASRAFRWTSAGGMQDLGVPSGSGGSAGWALSADGSMVGGTDGAGAVVWTQGTGWVRLRDYLTARGVNVGAWNLLTCYAISSDGTAMGGTGMLNGLSRGWVVQGLPSGCAPVVTQQPVGAVACPTGSAVFSVAFNGADVVTRWQVEVSEGTWVSLGHDPFPLPCGGHAAALDDSPSHGVITIRPCAGVAQYRVRALLTNACGAVPSDPAAYTVCRADFNCDGSANSQDFFDFLGAFFGGTADFNADGRVDSQDFFDFLAVFFAGC
jgi:probable HAF family extracellular repeat protein